MERSNYSKNFIDHFTKIKFLFLIIGSIGLVVLIINLEGQETSILVGNLLYIPVTFFMAISSYALLRKQRKIDDKDKGWLIFFSAIVLWLVAEHVWMISELVFHSKPFPSLADFFYIGGYILFGIFIFKMLWPLKNYISLNTKLFSTLIVTIFLVPTIFIAHDENNDFLSLALSLAYPVMDGALLWFGILVLSIPFTSKSGKFWTLISIGIVSLLVGDTIFSYADAVGSYYTGYPFEIFFYIAYIMFGYASIIRTKQALAHTPLIEEIKEKFQECSTSKSLISTRNLLLILSVCSVIIFFVLIFENGVTQNLSEDEIKVITPVGYIVSGIVIITIIAMLFSIKKLGKLDLKTNQVKQEAYKKKDVSDAEIMSITLHQTIDKSERRLNVMIPFWISLVVILVATSTYIITSTISEIGESHNVVQSGRFLVENLQGSLIDTWATWYSPPTEPLHVTIVNSHLIDDTKLQAIKDAILSKGTIMINSQNTQNPSNKSAVYYEGWEGALDRITKQNPTIHIPTNFEINESDKAVGDIIIILSADSEGDGSLGFTKSISDAEHHQILKSFITIFDVVDLSNKELGDITRHEFGHALGLHHSSNPEDLMSPKFHADRAYISQCDTEYLASLYDGHGTAIPCFG